MTVSQLLDKTTVVIAGTGVQSLKAGDDLLILAIGPKLPGLDVPLVVRKADVVVETATKYYAVARTPEYEATVESGIAVLSGMSNKKVWRRDPLKVEEGQLIGNPGWGPVAVGDHVIKAGELSDFVDHLAATASKKLEQ
jgi:hypothetical protein